MANPCIKTVHDVVKERFSEKDAEDLVNEVTRRLHNADASKMTSSEEKLTQIAKDMVDEDRIATALARRNAMLTVKAVRRVNDFVSHFKTMGEGLNAFINGTRKKIPSGRMSVDAQSVALKQQYAGELLAGLEQADLVQRFKTGAIDHEIVQELWSINEGKSVTGNADAYTIAKIVNNVQQSMIARVNRAGGFINDAEHYVMRQTHDPVAIRKAGGIGYGEGSNEASYKVWSEFIRPLLDEETTSGAAAPHVFLRGAHAGILTGVHGKSEVPLASEFTGTGALARRVSKHRILFFKDADSFYAYNQRFGTRSFSQGIISDIRRQAMNIALMENFGPNPEMTFQRILRKYKEEARKMPNDVEQMKKLESGFLQGSFDHLLGKQDIPESVTVHNITRALQLQATLSKLGGVTLSAIPDKAFFHAAGRYQGLRGLDLFAAQLGVFVPRTNEEKINLHLMGAALDGFLGEVAGRFTGNDNYTGRLMVLQQSFFRLNGMNWWNDVHKGAFAKLTSANLGEHGHLTYSDIPPELSRLLSLYGIDSSRWDIVRKQITKIGDHTYLTPDSIKNVPIEDIDSILKARGEETSYNNRMHVYDELETQIRTLISDQADDAVLTPGNKERVITNLNTRSGTIVGAAARMLMLFKTFPITVLTKVAGREVYGRGANNIGEWLRKDRLGNFHILQVIALATIGGYVAGAIKDALKGRTPKRIAEEDGTFNWDVLADSMMRGGGLGIYGDLLLTEYDRSYKNFLNILAGPIVGQLPEIAATATDFRKGKDISRSAEKLGLNNTPFINLFYIRPVLDYIILWNLEEMLSPGSMRKMERNIEKKQHQGFIVRPSEVVK